MRRGTLVVVALALLAAIPAGTPRGRAQACPTAAPVPSPGSCPGRIVPAHVVDLAPQLGSSRLMGLVFRLAGRTYDEYLLDPQQAQILAGHPTPGRVLVSIIPPADLMGPPPPLLPATPTATVPAPAIPLPRLAYNVSGTAHGLKLSLFADRTVYPWNALVPVMLEIQNVSARPIGLSFSCLQSNPWVQNVDIGGNVHYPPAVASLAQARCGPGSATLLAPGQVVDQRQYVIAHGRYLQAEALIAPDRAAVITPRFHLHLIAGRPPAIGLASFVPLRVDIAPGELARGSGRYTYSLRCHFRASGREGTLIVSPADAGTGWATIRASRIPISLPYRCVDLLELHVAAAWPGSATGTLDYSGAAYRRELRARRSIPSRFRRSTPHRIRPARSTVERRERSCCLARPHGDAQDWSTKTRWTIHCFHWTGRSR